MPDPPQYIRQNGLTLGFNRPNIAINPHDHSYLWTEHGQRLFPRKRSTAPSTPDQPPSKKVIITSEEHLATGTTPFIYRFVFLTKTNFFASFPLGPHTSSFNNSASLVESVDSIPLWSVHYSKHIPSISSSSYLQLNSSPEVSISLINEYVYGERPELTFYFHSAPQYTYNTLKFSLFNFSTNHYDALTIDPDSLETTSHFDPFLGAKAKATYALEQLIHSYIHHTFLIARFELSYTDYPLPTTSP